VKHTIQELIQIATLFAEAEVFKVEVRKDEYRPLTMPEVFVRLQAGAEVGIGPYAACDGISSIKGKLTFSANVQAALVKASGRYDYIIKSLTDQECVIGFYQKHEGGWDDLGISTFTMKDAREADLLGRGFMWKKYPRNMLFSRALTNGVAWHCPDVVGGVRTYTSEELGHEDEGDVPAIEVVEPTQSERDGGYVTVTKEQALGTASPFSGPITGVVTVPVVKEAYKVKKVGNNFEVEVRNTEGTGTWVHVLTLAANGAYGCSCGASTVKGAPTAGCAHAQAVRDAYAKAKADQVTKTVEHSPELEEALLQLDAWAPNTPDSMTWAITDPTKQQALATLWGDCLKAGVDINQLFDVTDGAVLPDLKDDDYASVEIALRAILKSAGGAK